MTQKTSPDKNLEILKKNTTPKTSKEVEKIIETNYGGYKENVSQDDDKFLDKAKQLVKSKYF